MQSLAACDLGSCIFTDCHASLHFAPATTENAMPRSSICSNAAPRQLVRVSIVLLQQFCCNLITQLPSLVDHRLIEEKHLNCLKIHSRPTIAQNLRMRLHILGQLEWLHQVSTRANHGCAVLVSMLLRLGGRHFHVPVQMNPCAKVGKSPILKAVHSHLGAICSPTIVHPCVLI